MAEPTTVPDANSSFEDKIAYLRSQNIPEETIAKHFSQSDDPSAQAWSKQFQMTDFEKRARAQMDANPTSPQLQQAMGNVAAPAPVSNGLVTAAGHIGDKFGKWFDSLSTEEQIALPVGTYLGSKLVNFGFNTLKDKVAAQTQINKYSQIQQIRNATAQQTAATQAAQITPTPPATPTSVAATPTAISTAPTPTPAAGIAPATNAPAESPAFNQLKQEVQAKQNAAPVSPETATPAGTETPTTTAEVVTNPNATPVEKAVTLTQEAPPAKITAPETKVKGAAAPRAERGSLAGVAMNPPAIEGMPGMREQYNIPKGINPATGEKFMGPGGFNYLFGQLGPIAQKAWEEQYGQRNVPAKQVIADYAATRHPPTSLTVEGKSGGSFDRPKFIPDYIKGAATPAALATTAVLTALPALGVAAVKKYQGNEAAVNASLQDAKESLKSLATMPYDVSKAALNGNFAPLKDLMLSMNPGSLLFNEMDKHDEEIIKKMIQKEKVGAGRGMQGVPPPTR